MTFWEILRTGPKISHLHLFCRFFFFCVWSSCWLPADRDTDQKLSEHETQQAADRGCGFQFWHANCPAQNWLTGRRKPVWNIWPHLPFYGNKVHSQEYQDNDDVRRLWNTLVLLDLAWTWFCAFYANQIHNAWLNIDFLCLINWTNDKNSIIPLLLCLFSWVVLIKVKS